MSEDSIKIELPKARTIRPTMPIIAIIVGGFLLLWGRRNVIARLGGAVALGLGIKGLFDIRSDRNKANDVYNKAIDSLGHGNSRDSLKKLEEGLELDKTNPYLNYGLVMVNYQNRNFKNVLKYIDNIDMERVKKRNNILFDEDMFNTLKGVSLYEAKNYEETIDFLENKKDSQNLYKLLTALSYRELGDLESSIDVLSSGVVVENKDDELAFEYWKGINLFDLDRKEEAKEVFEKVYGIDKNYIDIKQYMNRVR